MMPALQLYVELKNPWLLPGLCFAHLSYNKFTNAFCILNVNNRYTILLIYTFIFLYEIGKTNQTDLILQFRHLSALLGAYPSFKYSG